MGRNLLPKLSRHARSGTFFTAVRSGQSDRQGKEGIDSPCQRTGPEPAALILRRTLDLSSAGSAQQRRHKTMRLVLGLLFFSVAAFAETPSDNAQGKPAVIQDGQSAQAYISTALYEYLDKPPYLVIHAETPFFGKCIAGKNMWIALVEFYCGESEQNRLHGLTVIVYDPSTNEHRFMKPDEVTQAASGDAV